MLTYFEAPFHHCTRIGRISSGIFVTCVYLKLNRLAYFSILFSYFLVLLREFCRSLHTHILWSMSIEHYAFLCLFVNRYSQIQSVYLLERNLCGNATSLFIYLFFQFLIVFPQILVKLFWHVQERKEREARAAEGGWTVVVHHKGRKKTTDAESGIAVGSVAQAAVEDKMAKKKKKDVGLDFYRFQRREAKRNGITKSYRQFIDYYFLFSFR